MKAVAILTFVLALSSAVEAKDEADKLTVAAEAHAKQLRDLLDPKRWVISSEGGSVRVQSKFQLETFPAMSASLNPEGYEFPWGDEFNPDRLNTTESNIGATSPVGCFPAGVTPCGAHDMAGNVREWTRSVYRGYPYDPSGDGEASRVGPRQSVVLRGGAFNYNRRYARCAYRNNYPLPNFRYDYIGFRVVASPFGGA